MSKPIHSTTAGSAILPLSQKVDSRDGNIWKQTPQEWLSQFSKPLSTSSYCFSSHNNFTMISLLGEKSQAKTWVSEEFRMTAKYWAQVGRDMNNR